MRACVLLNAALLHELYSLHAGHICKCAWILSSADFSFKKTNVFQHFFWEYDQSVKRFYSDQIFDSKIDSGYYSDVRNLLEINGGSEHRYSSSMSGSLLLKYLARWVQDLSVASK